MRDQFARWHWALVATVGGKHIWATDVLVESCERPTFDLRLAASDKSAALRFPTIDVAIAVGNRLERASGVRWIAMTSRGER